MIMKNFKFIQAGAAATMFCLAALVSCMKADQEPVRQEEATESKNIEVTPEGVARMLGELDIDLNQVREVWNAAKSSADNGYDEEYTFENLLRIPGMGVGDTRASADSPEVSMKDLIMEYSDGVVGTRSGSFISELSASGLQIYWPYSEDWDGSTMPVITFDPENGSESNVAFQRIDGTGGVQKLMVDEKYAMEHPVWVINRNDDAEFITPQMMEKLSMASRSVPTRSSDDFSTLVLKEFKTQRNYDSWFAGGSEFLVKCGSLESFKARTEEEMMDYDPHITDFMIKVRRKQVGRTLRFNSILVSEWTSQLSECAFLVIEDDGGKMTTWTATGVVKIKSRSYGFEVSFPYHRSDDIVWRGSLSDRYFEKYNGRPARFGDVNITFGFE